MLLLLTWPLPIIVLDRRKASGAASLTATGIAVALLAAVKLLTTQVHRPPDEVELGLTGAVASVLAALSLISLLLGTGLGVRAYRRRQPGGKAALVVNLVALGAPVLLCLVAELRS
ncbi:hypothetical protein LLH23_00860 [bacterium]|nr:hypothetical protein [bacterium]